MKINFIDSIIYSENMIDKVVTSMNNRKNKLNIK